MLCHTLSTHITRALEYLVGVDRQAVLEEGRQLMVGVDRQAVLEEGRQLMVGEQMVQWKGRQGWDMVQASLR